MATQALPQNFVSLNTLPAKSRAATQDPLWLRALLIGTSITFTSLLLVLPLIVVFAEALRDGVGAYLKSFQDPAAWHAIKLTVLVSAIAVPLNLVFGVVAAWAIAKFEFTGKSLLITLIDLPFAVSPIISGVIFVLLFGLQGWLGPWLRDHNLQIIFAVPGIVLATIFV